MAETDLNMSPEKVVELVNQIMVDVFEADAGSLRPDASLIDDLELDSLDGVDLVIALEKTFSCKISEDEARAIRTMEDIYARVMERLGLVESRGRAG